MTLSPHAIGFHLGFFAETVQLTSSPEELLFLEKTEDIPFVRGSGALGTTSYRVSDKKS
jgi:hypothetical protein